MVRMLGNWLCDGKMLIFDDVVIVGLEYILLKNW